MEIQKITYDTKKYIRNDPNYPKTQTITDEDMNEIKSVVNNNADKQSEDYLKLKSAALNAETEESKSIHVTDANKFGQLSVEGNQKQETREGYSLIDFSSIGNGNLGGVSYSVENDIITLNGNYNINYPQPINNIVNNIPKINSNFRFQIYPISGSCENTRIGIRFNYANGEQIDYIQDVVNSNNYVTKAMNLTELNTVSFFIAGKNDATFNNYKFKLMFIEGTEEKPYEQYGASPSPNYPSKVVCLGSNKNILNTSLMIETTKGGVTSKINSDGSITFNGTCTTNNNIFNFYIENTTNFMFDAVKNQTTISAFYVSGSITDFNNSGAYFRVNDKSYAGGYINLVNLPQQKQLTRIYNSTSGSVFCDIRFNNGVVLDNFTIKCKAANTLEDALTYSPYGQGSTLISKINKNLFNKETAIQGLLEGDGSLSYSDSRYYTSDFIQVIPGQTYYKTYSGSSRFKFFDKNKNPISNTYNDLTDPTGAQSLIIPENVHYIRFTFLQTSLDSIQIEKSSDGTEYIEHQQTDYILNIQQEMLKGDYFIKESDGYKELHNWNKLILNGTETIERVGTSVSGKYRFAITVSGIQTGNFADTEIVDNLISNELTVVSNNITWNCAEDNVMHIRINNTPQIIIYIEKCSQMTVDEFKAFLQELYDEGKAIEIYYKLATPTKLPCTKEQSAVLEELSNLDLFEGVNNIITAEDIALLKLKYALDVKTYVDNKLNTINQQILNIAGGN